MLFQIEVILRAASLLIIVIVPLIWIYRAMTKPKTTAETVTHMILDEDPDNNNIGSDDNQDAETSEDSVPVDPVIAAMHREEQQYSASEDEAGNGGDTEELQDDGVEETVAGGGDSVETENDYRDEIDGEAEFTNEIVIEQTQTEIIEIDHDGDGEIDELVVQLQQTTTTIPTDLIEAKRQKSIDMIQFELRHLKDKGQAAAYEKKLIEARALHSEVKEFTTMLADHYYEQGEYKKSLGLYRALVSSDSSDDKSLAMTANCYIKLNEWDNAQIILEKLVQDKAENPRYWMSLAEVYYHNQELDKTIECVKTMVKLRPSNSDYLSTLAQLYYESAYYDLYVQVLYRMLELDPLNHDIKAEIEKYT